MISSNDEARLAGFEQLLPEFKKYTALFFASDFYALEACAFFQSKGIQIPEDISVVGFDDLLYARLTRPRLTTMRQDVGEKARLAVEGLLSMRNNSSTSQIQILPVQLVERESVRDIEIVHKKD